MKIKNLIKKYWPLFLVLIIGGSFRLYGLLQNPISLFSDEVDMGYQALSVLKTGCDYSGFCLPVQFHSFSDVQPPIPIYLIALAHLLGVPLDYSIRLISALAGTLGILFTFLLAKNLNSKKIFNLNLPRLGLFSSLVLAIIPWHITYSRIGFSLTLFYLFVTTGLYLYTKYLIKKKNLHLYLSLIFLGLTPMAYNTGKMSIIFFPLALLLLPGAFNLFKKNLNFKIALVLMYIPLLVMFLAGGTTARFDYISVFTDPTAPTEVDYQRLLDSGPFAPVGTSPSVFTRFIHNKPFWLTDKVIINTFTLLSTDFLFIKGDPNLRHSPLNSGMLYRSLAPLILLGMFFLINKKHNRLLILLGLLITISISTSAITREGGSHASRSFLLIMPLIIFAGIGLSYLMSIKKIILYIALAPLLFETVFFTHDYWLHYQYASERSWSAGMKELIQRVEKYPNQPVVISPKYENPLIFYLFYTEFDPKKFQQLIKTNSLFNDTKGENNLDGNRIGDTNLYIAALVDFQNIPEKVLPNAIYFLTKSEIDNSSISSVASVDDPILLPSGDPIYYEVHY